MPAPVGPPPLKAIFLNRGGLPTFKCDRPYGFAAVSVRRFMACVAQRYEVPAFLPIPDIKIFKRTFWVFAHVLHMVYGRCSPVNTLRFTVLALVMVACQNFLALMLPLSPCIKLMNVVLNAPFDIGNIGFCHNLSRGRVICTIIKIKRGDDKQVAKLALITAALALATQLASLIEKLIEWLAKP